MSALRRLWEDLALVPHRWKVYSETLEEPGISNVYSGQYARYLVQCARCHEIRKVWVGISPQKLREIDPVGCPLVRTKERK